jgi:hypothetical protein
MFCRTPAGTETCPRALAKPDFADEAPAKRGRLNSGNPPGDFTKADERTLPHARRLFNGAANA